MRTFYLETRSGNTIGTIEARSFEDAIERAKKRYKAPVTGWGSVRVTMELSAEALRALSEACTKVRAHLRASPGENCPEGCAARARTCAGLNDHAMAIAWYAAASAASIGHSRSRMYDDEAHKHKRLLDPEWQPSEYDVQRAVNGGLITG